MRANRSTAPAGQALRRAAPRLATILALVAVVLPGLAPAAFAQPANDDIANATTFAALPFSDGPVDTTTATGAPDDPNCATGPGSPTVWYAFTPTSDVEVGIDTFGSDYDTTLSAYTGSPGNLTQVACNDDAPGGLLPPPTGTLQSAIVFEATGGVTYYIMVGAYGSGPGGTLFLHADVPPPPLEIDLTVDRFGSVTPKTGVATVRGTISCTSDADYLIFGELEQRTGSASVRGVIFTEGTCTAPSSAWSDDVTSPDGRYRAGPARINFGSAGVCDGFTCDSVPIGPIRVILRGR
jgi:hypothetical protein